MLPLFANRAIDSAGNLPSPYLIDWTRQVVAELSATSEPEAEPEPEAGYLLDTTVITAGAGISVYGSLASGAVVVGLEQLADSGTGALLGITRDAYGRVSGTTDATITGTSGEIDVADGDAVAGPPTLSLATVTDAGGGTLQKTAFDTKGRKTGTSAATTTDLAEGANLYFTAGRVRGTFLVGLSTATNAIITAADTVLTALGKLQAQITANLATLTSHTGNTSNPHSVTAAQAGAVATIVAGTNITVDDTDPQNPVIAASGGSGAVDSVNGQTGVVVLDAADVGADPTGTAAAIVAATITDADTTHAPSGDAVFDALALKADASGFASGTYAPTLTNTTNVSSSSTPSDWQYLRVGSVATFSGQINITPTASGTGVEVQATLPVASDLAAFGSLAGAGAVRTGGVLVPVQITGDPTTNRIRFIFDPTTAIIHAAFFSCTYVVV